MENTAIERAKEHFGNLLEKQIERVEAMKESADFVDYNALDTIKIGLIGGDGIGPAITDTAPRRSGASTIRRSSKRQDRVPRHRRSHHRESRGALAIDSGTMFWRRSKIAT